ncbi:transcriptional regulator, AraC family [Myroides odoratimimus]|uniref:helix-turn-helix domain-containing protein n=1 Tax=Myroides TaxID=76831 RepID=UPI000280A3D3|nr:MULTISPECIES: helix-turn-helix domain-containing protein [Myroides]EKB03340.1 hypothetical protein HMPREF9711_02667 [Myroides odoratimimus CCUG 3837]EPH11287.1 hypothetical protein HMPREF9713_01773 [Myroides odoratimimus CCUG 12700]MCS7474099.1 helix-turn-helix domain-containing protein [Myroides odoratimimus]MDM1395903.1 AraC family transcriptional regulator [Myroides odoratimimus]MDM1401287.1 AraC family transcriptional regulator [Myroides odoratimimus]
MMKHLYFGTVSIDITTDLSNLDQQYSGFFKILFLKAGSQIQIDFTNYTCEQDAFFFFNEEHAFQILDQSKGKLIYFHADFYCVEIHDQELACDGILYSNVLTTPYVYLKQEQNEVLCNHILEIEREKDLADSWSEEKIRILIKYIIIEATRTWVKRENNNTGVLSEHQEFSRKFSQLVDRNYMNLHKVGDYAALLNVTTNVLNKRITKGCGISPSCVIVNRLILQAKRLLAYTDLSVKEIAFSLGYEDVSYFNRYFKIQTSYTPLAFRRNQELSKRPY